MAESARLLGTKPLDRLDPLVGFVVSHVEKVTGLGFEAKDLPGIDAKLQRRAASLGFSDVRSYSSYLKANLVSETPHLIGLLTTHHTAFFREFVHFQELERTLIPRMLPFLAQRTPRPRLNVWSAAASRGQEAYSLAMFLEKLSSQNQIHDYSILATDIDPHSVNIGQNGVYLAREVNQSPSVYLANHWSRGRDELTGWMRAKSSLKRRIEFRAGNLLQPSPSLAVAGNPSGKMDIIFCRNVFLYFRKEQIEQTMRYLLSQLEPWGVICLGVCENLNDMNLAVSPLGHSIFVPKSSPHLSNSGSSAKAVSGTGALSAVRAGTVAGRKETSPVIEESPALPQIVRVLAVDDSATVLALLKKVLTPADGFEVVATAKNLTEARAAVARLGRNFDLMTLDLHLGEETGIDYLKSIPNRADHVPVVVVSGLNRESAELAQAAIALGAVDYVEKPEGNNLERMGQELRAKLSIASASRVSGAKQSGNKDSLPPAKSYPGTAEQQNKIISVVIVDDSPTMTRVLREMIDARPVKSTAIQSTGSQMLPAFRVVATVTDPKDLAEVLRKHKPNVMTLDMNMPCINGVELLRQLPADLQVPAVVVSSLGLEQGSLVLDALAAGAVDYFPKPALQDVARETSVLLEKLASASQVKVKRKSGGAALVPARRRQLAVVPNGGARNGTGVALRGEQFSNSLILIGASTGGTEAIREVLATLPLDMPPICIVQHIPPVFSAAFAARLQETCARPVVEVKDGAPLLPGNAYVAPGDKHFTVRRSSSGFVAALLDTPKRGGHKPSVDVLFESAAELRGIGLYGVLMTGMGKDGAEGLRKLRQRGAHTICQSEGTCVVYGMPRAGVELGAAEFSEDLDAISGRLTSLVGSEGSSKNSPKN
jgi:chemotaxis protein methyltransferase CheR